MQISVSCFVKRHWLQLCSMLLLWEFNLWSASILFWQVLSPVCGGSACRPHYQSSAWICLMDNPASWWHFSIKLWSCFCNFTLNTIFKLKLALNFCDSYLGAVWFCKIRGWKVQKWEAAEVHQFGNSEDLYMKNKTWFKCNFSASKWKL